MADLFNTLFAQIVCDESGTHTDLFTPSGKLKGTIPATEAQPRFAKQRFVCFEGNTYYLVWKLTPATPKIA